MLDSFEYVKPASLTDALDCLEETGALPLAGGTDVLVNLRDGKLKVKKLVDLKGIKELKGIEKLDHGVRIGALTSTQEIVRSPLLESYCSLKEGASRLGCLEIRWRATIGGNICNGSPSADTVPGLLLYNAEVVLFSKEGERRMSLESFLLGSGKVNMTKGEILTAVILSDANPLSSSRYHRISRVKGMDLSSVNVGVYAEKGRNGSISNVRIALGAVLPKVSRMHETEEFINSELFTERRLDEAINNLLVKLSPREGSLRATPAYKKEMVAKLIKEGLLEMIWSDRNEA